MDSEKNLYLFDFDGTLTRVDTLFDFLRHSFLDRYKIEYIKFIPLFILAKLSTQNTEKVKQKFIASFLKGRSRSEIKELAESYFEIRGRKILREKGLDYIRKIDNHHDKYIVSASLDIWLEPFAHYLDVGLICTKAEFDLDEIFTGKFLTPNCNHHEKKIRIEQELDLNIYKEIFVFGDTKGDNAMLSLATRKFFKGFNN